MTTELQKTKPQPSTTKPSAIQLMASRCNVDPIKLYETLKGTIFPKATEQELLALIVIANQYELSPFLRQIYAFPAKGGGIVPVVSVDGWNSLLIRQPDFDGIDFEFIDGEDGKPYSCTATIYVKNRSHAVKITEYFDECKRDSEPWRTMPRRMLRNRTLCQASRVAFGFSGIKQEDEVIEIESVVVETQRQLPNSPPPKTVPAGEPGQPPQGEAGQPPKGAQKTPQQELEAIVISAGFTFTDLQKFGKESGNIDDAASVPDFASISTENAVRLVRAKKGLIDALNKQAGKGGLLE